MKAPLRVRIAAVSAVAALGVVTVAAAAGAAARARSRAPGFSNVQVAPKHGGGEPSIAVGPEGNQYVSFPSDDGMSFFRSTTNGKTWTAGKIADSYSGDTTINVDSSGSVYQGNLAQDGFILQGDVWKSPDFGATWPQKGSNFDGSSSSNPFLVDRPWTDSYIPPGKTTNKADVYLVYHDFVPSQIWVNVSTDGGKTFGPPMDAITSPEAEAYTICNSIPGGVKVVQSGPHAGRVYVAWLGADPVSNVAMGCNLTQLQTFHTVWTAWSDDHGATWTDQLVFDGGFGHGASALFADLTLDDQGNPYVAFGDNLKDEWDMYVMASFDGGKKWNGKSEGTGAPYKVNSDKGTHFFPAIAAGDPGKVDVAWIATDKVIDTLPYGKPTPGGGDGAKWSVYFGQSTNLLSGQPTWTVVKANPAVIHTGDVCTLGLFCAVGEPFGANRSLLDFIDLALDARGRGHVAYTADQTKATAGIYVANQTRGNRVR